MTSKTDQRIRGTGSVPPQPTHFEELKKAVEDAISDGEDGHGLWFKVRSRTCHRRVRNGSAAKNQQVLRLRSACALNPLRMKSETKRRAKS